MGKATQTQLEIDLNALDHNYRYLVSRLNTGTRVLGVVKAMGYGSHGTAIAQELEKLGVDYLAVAYVSEGVALRDAGVETPILVLHPQPVNFKELIERCLEPAIYSFRVLKAFVEMAEGLSQAQYPIHLKFNTGLNRLGFAADNVEKVVMSVKASDSIRIKSVFSHLAASEDLQERVFTLGQIEAFKSIADQLVELLGYRPWFHQSNTSAILNYPEAHFDMVRTGIGLYGYGNNPEADSKLKPVARLKSVISQIHMVKAGDTVGYNRAFTASGKIRTGTIPIGHADGIPRSLGNQNGYVLIGEQRAPIIGNVCMDMIMVSLEGIDCEEGDEVLIIGEDLPATLLAAKSGTISYETLTAISQRIPRILVRN
jgi:alanine racemase